MPAITKAAACLAPLLMISLTACAERQGEPQAWRSRSFYPPEACWEVHSMSRNAPNYWSIRRYCDSLDENERD